MVPMTSPVSDLPGALKGARILVVEDEAFIALDLVMAIEDAGAIPVGPAATIAEALELISYDPRDGAILDVDLPDGTIGPMLDALAAIAGVVAHTGAGVLPDIRAAHPNVPVFSKPTAPDDLLRRIAHDMKR
jgi:DNA-binding NtrC family response regulator